MKLVRNGIGYYRAGGIIGPAQWKAYDLIVILEGSFTFERPEKGLNVATSDAVLIPPGVLFEATAGKQGGAISVMHLKPGPKADPFPNRAPETLWFFPSAMKTSWRKALLERVHETASDARDAREGALLLSLLLKEIQKVDQEAPPSPLEDALQWAARRDWKEVSVEALARHAGFSTSHFRARFAAEKGCSVGHYLRERKMEIARRLLQSADHPIKEISERLGYSEVSAFHHAFVGANGCTPGEYRLRNPMIA